MSAPPSIPPVPEPPTSLPDFNWTWWKSILLAGGSFAAMSVLGYFLAGGQTHEQLMEEKKKKEKQTQQQQAQQLQQLQMQLQMSTGAPAIGFEDEEDDESFDFDTFASPASITQASPQQTSRQLSHSPAHGHSHARARNRNDNEVGNEQEIDFAQRSLNPDVQALNQLSALMEQAEYCRQLGRYAEAAEYYRLVTEVFEKIEGSKSPHVYTFRTAMASCHMADENFSEAEKVLVEALAGMVKNGLGEEVQSETKLTLAELYLRTEREDKAEPLAKSVVEFLEVNHQDEQRIGLAKEILSGIKAKLRKFEEALELAKQALIIFEENSTEPYNAFVVKSKLRIAQIHADTGRFQQAAEYYKSLLEAAESSEASINSSVSFINLLARAYINAGSYNQAEELYEKYIDADIRKNGDNLDSMQVLLKHCLMCVFKISGKEDEANKIYNRLKQSPIKLPVIPLGISRYFATEHVRIERLLSGKTSPSKYTITLTLRDDWSSGAYPRPTLVQVGQLIVIEFENSESGLKEEEQVVVSEETIKSKVIAFNSKPFMKKEGVIHEVRVKLYSNHQRQVLLCEHLQLC